MNHQIVNRPNTNPDRPTGMAEPSRPSLPVAVRQRAISLPRKLVRTDDGGVSDVAIPPELDQKQRDWLERFRDQGSAWLTPICKNPDSLARAVMEITLSMAQGYVVGQEPKEFELLARDMVIGLSDLPLASIQIARRDWQRTQRRRPTVADLRELAKPVIDEMCREMAMAADLLGLSPKLRLLAPKPRQTDEERDAELVKIGETMARFRKRFGQLSEEYPAQAAPNLV